MRGVLTVAITLVLGAMALTCCLFPLGWAIGQYPADSREIVPGIELCQIDGKSFWLERMSDGHQFHGRPKFNEAITGVAVSDDGKTLCIEFSGDLGVLYAVYPNRSGLVRPALFDTNGHLEPWPDWLGYVGDLESFATLTQDPSPGLGGLSSFRDPIEFLRNSAQ